MSLFSRTFHPDEANQAFTVGKLLETGTYAYRPDDHHGPTLYYAAAPLQQAFGHTTTATLDGTLLRCTPLVFAVLALLLGAGALRRLTRKILPAAAFILILGTSPAFAFFATDFIQEMLLSAFLAGMLFTGVSFLLPAPEKARFKPGTWALFFGVAAGLALATKETAILAFAAALAAAAPLLAKVRVKVTKQAPALALAGFLLTVLLLFSSFAQDFGGLHKAFVAAPVRYLQRAFGSAASTGSAWHLHPWHAYLSWLFLGQRVGAFAPTAYAHLLGPVFLLAFVLPLAFRASLRKRVDPTLLKGLAFTAAYTLLLLSFHSLLPYKTPWCALQILVGLDLALALGLAAAGEILAPVLPRVARLLPLFVIGAILLQEHLPALVRLNRDPDARDIPYNYAAAHPQAQELAAILDTAFAAQRAQGPGEKRDAFAAVALPAADTWPLPWYNRRHEEKTGYWTAFADLARLAKDGARPLAVIVPMTDGHLVQPLFPYLTKTKRLFMRPGVRVRVFW